MLLVRVQVCLEIVEDVIFALLLQLSFLVVTLVVEIFFSVCEANLTRVTTHQTGPLLLALYGHCGARMIVIECVVAMVTQFVLAKPGCGAW